MTAAVAARHPLAEVQRLRAELADARRELEQLHDLIVMPGPMTVLGYWRDGYRAAEIVLADRYEAGFADGSMARKRTQHELVDEIRLEIARWGPGGRAHFADPRPGDYQGGLVNWDTRTAGAA